MPESLDEELKQRAAELGTSVSNLVRNVLQNTFEMVGEIVEDAGRVARSARGHSSGPGRPATGASGEQVGWVSPAAADGPAPEILGYQELVLAKNALCETCNGILPRGTAAAVAICDRPAPPSFLCLSCLEEVRRDSDQ